MRMPGAAIDCAHFTKMFSFTCITKGGSWFKSVLTTIWLIWTIGRNPFCKRNSLSLLCASAPPKISGLRSSIQNRQIAP